MAEVDETTAPDEPESPFQPPEQPADEPEEAEEDDEQPEPSEPAEDEPEPQGGLTEKEIEARFTKLGKENERHANRVGEILEDDATDLLMCPLCSPFIAGFLLNAPVADEPRTATLGFLGVIDSSELPQASYLVKCETCDGRGEVKTGSTRPGYESANCAMCEGKGYRKLTGQPQGNGTMSPDYIAPHDDFAPPPPDDDPAIVALKAAGYTVVPPFQPANAAG